ncbi:MAG: PEP-CTERM sorting domain-containing protein [Verrucomicrobia bacterium]|nr:PEP-CTERM sorting domain-containing protein [Verrucomicrobiota bacterium]
MKITPLTLMVLTMVLSVGSSDALVLQPGQSIGIDFGATPSTNHFNQWDPSNSATPADGILSIVTDTTGTTLPGVKVVFGGTEAQSTSAATTQDIANTPAFDLSNIEDAVVGYDLSMTFTGLAPGQSYTLSFVSSYSGRNIGTEFLCGPQAILTNSMSTIGETLAVFGEIYVDGEGKIVITTLGHDSLLGSHWVGVNAARLTANSVPEPSGWTLALLGMAGLVFVYRRASLQIQGSVRKGCA